jgi:hypothetical protein
MHAHACEGVFQKQQKAATSRIVIYSQLFFSAALVDPGNSNNIRGSTKLEQPQIVYNCASSRCTRPLVFPQFVLLRIFGRQRATVQVARCRRAQA